MNYGVNWRRHWPRLVHLEQSLWPLASCLSSRGGGAQQGIPFPLRFGRCHSTLIHPRPRKIRNILAFQFDTVSPDTRHVITSVSLLCPIILDNLARSYTFIWSHSSTTRDPFEREDVSIDVSKIRIVMWYALVSFESIV